MITWMIPALKAVLPHIGTIISATAPAFTKKESDASRQTHLFEQQIRELQSAASQNAAHVKELAEQLANTALALEQAESLAKTHYQRSWQVSLGALVISAISLCMVIFYGLML
ncbi:MAG: hypothetical protein NPIRA04_35380 [Nitrospirales bacterium]|nr:MAG: hypothetical protein NPIRA04_35380 [Nitrospirales bacterium]